jgi:hypothetical protein
MSEVDAQALQIRRKHVGLPHLYGEAPVAVEEARRHWERQLLVIAAELQQQQRRGQGGDGAAGADDGGGGCFLLGSDGMMVVDILLVTCLIDTLACGWLPAPEHLEASEIVIGYANHVAGSSEGFRKAAAMGAFDAGALAVLGVSV